MYSVVEGLEGGVAEPGSGVADRRDLASDVLDAIEDTEDWLYALMDWTVSTRITDSEGNRRCCVPTADSEQSSPSFTPATASLRIWMWATMSPWVADCWNATSWSGVRMAFVGTLKDVAAMMCGRRVDERKDGRLFD